MILANRFDYTISNIKYVLPADLPKQKAVLIMTAAYGQGEGNYDWVYPQDIDPLKHIGLKFELIDIADKDEAEVRENLDGVDIIIVTGGDTYYLLKHMRICNFGAILKEKLAEGVMYLATSAGAIVCSPDIDFIAPMDTPAKAGLTDFTGFNLIPFGIVPHLNHPHLAGAAHTIMRLGQERGEFLIGLLDEQFMVVNQSTYRIY
jgi:dipeptidase E